MNTEMITNIETEYKLTVGTSDFAELATASDLFVDKTLFIKDVIQDTNKVLLITRPRRWGKTLNMSMLKYFFSPNIKYDGSQDVELHAQKLQVLSGLKIATEKKKIQEYFGKYPTIFITFADVKATSFDEMLLKIKHVIHKVYLSHEYLLTSENISEAQKFIFRKYLTKEFDITETEDGIKTLSEMLHRHFGQKIIILIDEYDKPLNDWYVYKLSSNELVSESEQYVKSMLDLFSSIFGSSLKNNDFLEKGIVTGILRIAKASLFSGVNNLEEYTILDSKYAEYFGFTEEEVVDIVQRSGIDKTHALMQGVKEWYNGYRIGDYTIYNPWSIMKMIQKSGNLESYWLGTASPGLIQSALVLDQFQEEVHRLIEGETISMIADPKMVFSDIQSSPNALHNLLLFSGYLTATSANKNTDGNSYTCEVRIPNHEVRSVYTSSISAWLQNKFHVTGDDYIVFVKYLLSGNIDKFTEKLKSYLEASASYFDTVEGRAELLYNGFMWGLFASSMNQNYFVEKERETGDGRADLLIIPKTTAAYDIAFVLEYKVATKTEDLVTTANIALEQIKNKNYISKIKSHDNVNRIFSIGLAFCSKDVEVAYSELALNLNKNYI
jgi:hypothetical protein